MYRVLEHFGINQWFTIVDAMHLQSNTDVNTAGMLASLLPAGVTTCLLSGCTVTVTPALDAAPNSNGTRDYAITAGYLAHEGLIYEVAAQTINTVNKPYWAIRYSFLSNDVPVNDGNGVAALHQVGRAELVNNINQQGVLVEYDQLYYLRDYLRNNAEIGKIEMLVGNASLAMYDANGAGIGYNAGWQLLDGRNGFPDLTGAFPMGGAGALALALAGSNSKTIQAANLPVDSPYSLQPHAHDLLSGGNPLTAPLMKYKPGAGNAIIGEGSGNWGGEIVTVKDSSVSLQQNAGGGQALDITPKHFEVRYRLRVA